MANTETTIDAVMHPQPNETPIDIEKTIKALERNKFIVHYFETGSEAVTYLKNRIQNKCVAIGDSRTLLEIGVHDALSEVNEDITDIQRPLPGESFRDTALRTMGRDVFLTSVNALSQTGEMVNIDGTGNRVAASLFGSQEVFFVLGVNKITPDLASAIYPQPPAGRIERRKERASKRTKRALSIRVLPWTKNATTAALQIAYVMP